MAKKKDAINPSHYQTASGMQAVDVVEAFGLDWHLGSACKYLLRAGKKDDYIQDLEKCEWFIERAILVEQRKRAKRR